MTLKACQLPGKGWSSLKITYVFQTLGVSFAGEKAAVGVGVVHSSLPIHHSQISRIFPDGAANPADFVGFFLFVNIYLTIHPSISISTILCFCDMKASTWWDVFKAVVRGRLINWNNIEKKKKDEKLKSLLDKLIQQEVEFKKKPGKKKLEKEIRLLKE